MAIRVLDKLMALITAADRFQLTRAAADVIESLKLTDEHWTLVHQIALSLKETRMYRDSRLQQAFDAYFKQATDQCRTIYELIAYTDLELMTLKGLKSLTSLDLIGCNQLTNQALASLMKVNLTITW